MHREHGINLIFVVLYLFVSNTNKFIISSSTNKANIIRIDNQIIFQAAYLRKRKWFLSTTKFIPFTKLNCTFLSLIFFFFLPLLPLQWTNSCKILSIVSSLYSSLLLSFINIWIRIWRCNSIYIYISFSGKFHFMFIQHVQPVFFNHHLTVLEDIFNCNCSTIFRNIIVELHRDTLIM